jgi:hypothetical protein
MELQPRLPLLNDNASDAAPVDDDSESQELSPAELLRVFSFIASLSSPFPLFRALLCITVPATVALFIVMLYNDGFSGTSSSDVAVQTAYTCGGVLIALMSLHVAPKGASSMLLAMQTLRALHKRHMSLRQPRSKVTLTLLGVKIECRSPYPIAVCGFTDQGLLCDSTWVADGALPICEIEVVTLSLIVAAAALAWYTLHTAAVFVLLPVPLLSVNVWWNALPLAFSLFHWCIVLHAGAALSLSLLLMRRCQRVHESHAVPRLRVDRKAELAVCCVGYTAVSSGEEAAGAAAAPSVASADGGRMSLATCALLTPQEAATEFKCLLLPLARSITACMGPAALLGGLLSFAFAVADIAVIARDWHAQGVVLNHVVGLYAAIAAFLLAPAQVLIFTNCWAHGVLVGVNEIPLELLEALAAKFASEGALGPGAKNWDGLALSKQWTDFYNANEEACSVGIYGIYFLPERLKRYVASLALTMMLPAATFYVKYFG